MGKYYYLIAGLPDISLGDTKIPLTIAEFREELNGILSQRDKALIDLFFLKFDNRNLMKQVQHPDFDSDPRGKITYDEFNDLIQALKEKEKPPKNKQIPPYFEDFVLNYLKEEAVSGKLIMPWEDQLATLYYEYAMKCSNTFISDWFELNLNINNMLTAITCRKYNIDKTNHIVGNNNIAKSLRSSSARDFGLTDEFEYINELQRIADESDIAIREEKIDLLKWEWLEENTVFKTFDIESVFAYLLKLEMIERWVTLDKATGEETFRKIIGTMKKGSDERLEEFRRNNNK